VFDAVGTLILPEPEFGTVYEAIGRRHGSRRDAATIRQRFRAACARQDAIDREAGWRTSEARELERWRAIVGEVLDDAADGEACFAELYDHFSRPEHWRCETAALDVLASLTATGLATVLASNFDHRLRSVVAGWPALRALTAVVISAEVGWRKPAPEFFAAVCAALGLRPPEVLYVGDDFANDYAAVRAGCRALLWDPHGVAAADVPVLRQWRDVLTHLG
jgi:putative hydrolase of the HAD superfamily